MVDVLFYTTITLEKFMRRAKTLKPSKLKPKIPLLAIAILSAFPILAFPTVSPATSEPADLTQASAKSRWQPPAGTNAGSSLSGGRRGTEMTQCSLPAPQSNKALQLLVPPQSAGLLTTIAHPTFAWSIETTESVSMTFVLTDPAQAQPVYTETLEATTSGIAQVTLPDTISLEQGKRYRWTVMIACGSQGSQVYARSFIERVADSTPVAGTPLTQSNIYAERGIWYDALGVLLEGVAHHPEDGELAVALESLLQNTK